MGISGAVMIRSLRRWLTTQQQPVRPLARNKMVPAKTAPAVSRGPKDMATSSAAR